MRGFKVALRQVLLGLIVIGLSTYLSVLLYIDWKAHYWYRLPLFIGLLIALAWSIGLGISRD
jgi:hypothetical protein